MCSSVLHGWRFWSVEGDEPTAAEKPGKPAKASKPGAKKITEKEAKTTKRSPRKSTYRVIHLHEKQDDLMEGEVRWLCDACIKPFILPAGETPTECPNGHKIDDPELNTGAVATEVETE